jgi:hypothetical protein
MYQNGVMIHATDCMLDKNADLTQGCIGSLLRIGPLGIQILCALTARLLHDFAATVRKGFRIASEKRQGLRRSDVA